MKIRSAWIFLVLGWSFSVVLFGKEISSDNIIQNVEKTFTSAKTLTIHFQQTYIWKLTGEEQVLEGELLMEGEKKFRVTTEDQVIVSNGTTLWTYSKPSHRVLVDKLVVSDDALLPRQILFRYTQDYRSRVTGEEVILENPCYKVVLIAKTPDVFIPQVCVWIDKKEWVPRKVEQIDIDENRTIFLLRSLQMNSILKEETFRFTVPEGAEVIHMQ